MPARRKSSDMHAPPTARSTARMRPGGGTDGVDWLHALPHPCAVFDDASGEPIAANAAFEDAFGAPAPREALLSMLLPDRAVDPHGDSVGHLRVHHRQQWWLLAWKRTRRDARADWVLSATNISDQLESLRSESHQAERLMFTSRLMSVGEMSATIAHEINQPLAAIVNYLDGSLRLLERGNGPMPVVTAVKAAREQATHAGDVIARVREFVKAREPRRSAQPVEQVATAVMRLLALESDRHQVRVLREIEPGLPSVWADRVMIEQVLLNLLKNAMEALGDVDPGQRVIRIQGRVNLDGDVEVRVVDSGCGLSEAQREHLFTAFNSSKADGLGIGLSICRSIIEYHNGRLFHEARDGGGSVFGFTLPVAPDDGEAAA